MRVVTKAPALLLDIKGVRGVTDANHRVSAGRVQAEAPDPWVEPALVQRSFRAERVSECRCDALRLVFHEDLCPARFSREQENREDSQANEEREECRNEKPRFPRRRFHPRQGYRPETKRASARWLSFDGGSLSRAGQSQSQPPIIPPGPRPRPIMPYPGPYPGPPPIIP